MWYVDPQQYVNPGEIKLVNKYTNKEREVSSNIIQTEFILTPWQAEQLVDHDGVPMVHVIITGERAYGIKKTRNKKFIINKQKLNKTRGKKIRVKSKK